MNEALLVGLLAMVGVLGGVIYLLLRRQDLLVRALLAKTLAEIDPATLQKFGLVSSSYHKEGA